MVPGEVTGKLVGGNLSLLSATLGSPYQIPLTGKEILFIEDWNDDYESVDRLVSHLSHNGVWDRVGGIIVGEFYRVPRKNGDYGLKWEQVITDVLKEARKRKIPIGFNFPIGHSRNNYPIPIGVEAHFNSTTGTLSFLEPAVTSD
jgi:muramoyltetrapeptide carboxypeptidase